MEATSLAPASAKTPGTVITFYSFKGGVGRSMALANVAVLLARAGKIVLCIDWDLEAPGLDRYFRAVPRSSPNSVPSLSEPAKPGGLLAILEGSSPDNLDGWRNYVRTRTGAEGTRLDFIVSGDDDEGYSAKLGDFSWTEFFSQRKGGDVVEALRNAWKKNYDYVLIDSRTGLTDSSGVCTIQMPDLLVMLFAANEQNVDWCQRIARGVRSGRSKLPYDRAFLPIIPLLSRFDAREESDRAAEAMDRIAPQFASFFSDWLPHSITARDMLAWSVLPYVPRYSFEEALAVEDEPATGAQGLSFYYQLLSRLIVARFKGVRAILASVGVPGAARPPLLPSLAELDAELRSDPTAVKRYRGNIMSRAEEEPSEAAEAFETLAGACASTSRLRDAHLLLADATAILKESGLVNSDESRRLELKRSDLASEVGGFAKRFRIAFSFAGEKRGFVAEVADILAKRFTKEAILYDKYHEAEFSRGDLAFYLPDLYEKETGLVVAVFCPDYENKEWCGLEWNAIYGLLKTRKVEEVMLTRFKRVEGKGLHGLAGYTDLDDLAPDQTATLILERLALNEGLPKEHYKTDFKDGSERQRTSIPNNLPRLQYFFGREADLKKVGDALAEDARGWGALIDGPGGIGKTALAIRAAESVPSGRFRRIIFLSSKERELTADGQRALGYFVVPTYLEMLNAIARELEQPDLAKSSEAERSDAVLRALRDTEVLLVLDNLETLPEGDRDQLFAFLNRLPSGCSGIVTSRRRADASAVAVRLDRLDWAAARALLAELGRDLPRLSQASDADRRAFYEETGGNPLLIRWVAGQLGLGRCRSIAAALDFLRSVPAGNNPLEFIFGDLLDTFTANETKVLAALTHFTTAMEVKFIAELAGLNEAAGQGALSDLSSRALVLPDLEERRFALVPMVAAAQTARSRRGNQQPAGRARLRADRGERLPATRPLPGARCQLADRGPRLTALPRRAESAAPDRVRCASLFFRIHRPVG